MKTITELPLLVLSCRGLIERVFWEQIPIAAFDKALFFFDCPVEQIKSDLNIPPDLLGYPAAALAARRVVTQAIYVARKEGRASCCINRKTGWSELSNFLTENSEQAFPICDNTPFQQHAAVLAVLDHTYPRYLWW